MGCGAGVCTASDIVAVAAGASRVFSARLFVHLWVRSAVVRLRFPAKFGDLPSRNAEGSWLVSAFGERHRQDQYGEWQADRDGESERDHCSVLCCVVTAEPRGYACVPVIRSAAWVTAHQGVRGSRAPRWGITTASAACSRACWTAISAARTATVSVWTVWTMVSRCFRVSAS